MKVRNGFVSNSSSSSFVLDKNYLTDEQNELFRSKLKEINDAEYGETYISESTHYFQGEASQSDELLGKLIDEMGIDEFCSFVLI